MKLFFTLFLLISNLILNAQNIFWAKSASGNDLDEGNGIAVDNSGNVYIIGSFESATLNFGGQSVTNALASTSDIFVAKFDANGNCLWAKRVGGTDEDFGIAITVNKTTGDVYALGHFNSASISFTGPTITNSGGEDIILLKFDTNGNPVFGKGIGSNYDENATGISIDSNGNIYISGYYDSNSVNFGAATITNQGYFDIFVAKFNSSGVNQWAYGVGGSEDDRAYSISCDANNNVLLTGRFVSASISFGGNIVTNSNTNESNLFVAKFNSSGTCSWAKAASSVNGTIWGNAIGADNNGNVFVSGFFDGNSMTIINTITNSNPGGSNVYIAKYNASGVEQWVTNPTSGPEGNQTYCLTVDNSGNVSISGWYTSPSVNFNGIPLSSAAIGDNIFLARYNTNGAIQNAYSFSGTSFSGGYGNGICSDASGNIYITGYFEGTNMKFGTTTLSNTGSYDVYWTKIGYGSTGISPLNEEYILKVFPNPSKGIINISPQWKEYSLEVINILGEVVYKNASLSGNTTIDISNQINGIYLLKFQTTNGTLIQKILLEK